MAAPSMNLIADPISGKADGAFGYQSPVFGTEQGERILAAFGDEARLDEHGAVGAEDVAVLPRSALRGRSQVLVITPDDRLEFLGRDLVLARACDDLRLDTSGFLDALRAEGAGRRGRRARGVGHLASRLVAGVPLV